MYKQKIEFIAVTTYPKIASYDDKKGYKDFANLIVPCHSQFQELKQVNK